MDGVINVNPVSNKTPPFATSNQFTLEVEDAVNITAPVPHRTPSVRTGADGAEVMIACTATRELLHTFPVSR
jgi:hypothetical protein